MAPIQRIDIVAPLLQRGQPLGPRAVGIGDVVDLAAEAVDLEHRLALLARQNAHRRVERTAGRSRPVIGVGCRRLKRHAPAAGLDRGRRPDRAPGDLACHAAEAEGEQLDSAPRCTRSLKGSRTFSRRTILSAKAWITEISSPSRKSFTSALSDLLSLSSAFVRTASECRHCNSGADALALAERLDRGAGGCQRIARQIDAIEVAKILAAVLQVIVDLQAGAERVGGRPGRCALAMDVEHEAADRHRRIAAIMDHLVPVLVAKLRHVHPERDQDVERMARRHRTLRQRAPQIDGLGLAVAAAQQFGFEQIEIAELVAVAERRMIGDVVGGSDEIVERQNQRPVARMDDPRRDRKVLVAVCLAGSQFARAGHQELATIQLKTVACAGTRACQGIADPI